MFSIIVPVYNTPKKYLSKCINSLINQTSNKYEIILVDDGSNEEYKEFLKQYDEYEKIKIIHKKHEGVSAARNAGINAAKEDYIMFIDSDDYVENDMCEKVEKYIIKNNRPDIICFDAYLEYKNKTIKIPMLQCKNNIIDGKDKEKLLIQIITSQCVEYQNKCNTACMVWNKAYNKDFINKNKLYFDTNVFHMEDLLFILYTFESANSIVYYDELIYHYIQNDKSLTHNFNVDFIKNNEYVLLEIEKFIKKYNKPEKFYRAFNLKVAAILKFYIIKCFFNKKNNYTYKEAKQKICKLIDKEIYKNALMNLYTKYLKINQKIIYYCIKHKKIFLLKLITSIRDLRNIITSREFY